MLQYIAEFKLVDANTQYEYRNAVESYTDGNGVIHIDSVEQRRAVETRTFEATIKDTENEIPPTAQNPANLSNPWHLDGLSFTQSLDTPNSRRIREVWVKRDDDWETIGTL